MNNLYIIIIFIIFYLLFFIINYNINKVFKYENFLNEQIPKIIIQTWKDNNIPNKYKNDINSIKNYNKDYKFLFFNDNDIDKFIKDNYPKYYISYNKLPVIIQKIDFFRYIAIYHYGGFYFDLDITGFKSFNDLLDYDCILPIDTHITYLMCKYRRRYKKYCNDNMKILLGQYAFGAKKNNKFIKLLIDTIHNNIDLYINIYNVYYKNNKLQYVYSTTGPDFVTNIYMNYNDKDNIHILYNKKNQYFGDYAKHNHYGTWK